jgi:hypothetical protein
MHRNSHSPPIAHGPNTMLCRHMYFSGVTVFRCRYALFVLGVPNTTRCFLNMHAFLQHLLSCNHYFARVYYPSGKMPTKTMWAWNSYHRTHLGKTFRLTSIVPDLFTLHINPLKTGFPLNNIYFTSSLCSSSPWCKQNRNFTHFTATDGSVTCV